MTTTTNISHPGQVNNAGDVLALYKDAMQPQLIKFYTDNLVAANFFSRQKISNAKAAEFTLIGKTSAQYVAAGTERNGTNTVPHNKILVPVDNFLSTDIFVAEDDEAMWHRDDVRQQYLEQMGIALALQEELYTFQVAVNAARSTSPITGGASGTILKNASMASDGAVLGAAFFSAAQTASEKNIRLSDMRAFLRPLQYFTLAQKLDYINSLYGGAGAIKDGTIFRVAGIDIKMTNCLPNTSVTKDALQRGTDYDGNFTKTVGLIAAPQAIGTVELIGMKVVTEAQPLKHGTMLAASNLIGKGVVNPVLAMELSSASA